jgi:hypothetical protein
MADNVRVVFCGRRPLAKSGYGWETDSDLQDRDMLRLFVVEGMSHRKAEKFLADYSYSGRSLPGEFHIPILTLAGADARRDNRFRPVAVPGIEPPFLRDEEVGPRYNPYDLDMYAEWAATDRKVTLEGLQRAGPHFYVEERIVGRLNGEIRSPLPQFALLGRFDVLLLDLIIADPARGRALREEFTRQEWVRADQGTSADSWLIESRLAKRILDYYRDREPGALAAARTSLAETLVALTSRHPLAELRPEYFSAAFEA